MGIIKKIKIKLNERKMRKDINTHLDAIEAAYETLISNYTFAKHYKWTSEVYEDLYDRVIEHDLDKFESKNFEIYRKYLYPVDPLERAYVCGLFSKTVNKHKLNNRHHWEARVNDDPSELTYGQTLDCFEEVIDMIARMGEQSLDYYEGFKNNMNIPDVQKDFIEGILFDLYKSKESY